MTEIVYTDDESLKCPNDECKSGFQPRAARADEDPGQFYCPDCNVPREPWPDEDDDGIPNCISLDGLHEFEDVGRFTSRCVICNVHVVEPHEAQS